ncbi:hypothetical protein ACFO0N_01545 [Halobium salinum]|uniref:Uncharacterized protein n=1 Tax=Halobium salinum TaxID=1364940 RepID=A0ABD5P7C1_9EURY|nr:hypothetical protein [Halobium salinum]
MSLASETRRAVRERPFLLAGLRAGVVNFTAAADFLDLDGDREAVATALRRYAEELPGYDDESRAARVTMQSGVAVVAEGGDGPGGSRRNAAHADGAAGDPHEADPLLAVGGAGLVSDGGSATAVVATGSPEAVDAAALGAVLSRLETAGVGVDAAAACGGTLLVVVDRREGATALRTVEAALDAVPAPVADA